MEHVFPQQLAHNVDIVLALQVVLTDVLCGPPAALVVEKAGYLFFGRHWPGRLAQRRGSIPQKSRLGPLGPTLDQPTTWTPEVSKMMSVSALRVSILPTFGVRVLATIKWLPEPKGNGSRQQA